MRVVAFDLGGVVVDVDKAVLVELGPNDAVARAVFHDGIHDRLTVGALDADVFIDAAANALGLERARVRRTWASMVRFSVGGLELVAQCASRGPVAIWSNTDPIHWSVLGPSLVPLSIDVAPSFEIGAMKPHPAYFAGVIARLSAFGVGAGDIVFVDDRVENVEAACACGIDAVVVNGVNQARAALVARGILSSRRTRRRQLDELDPGPHHKRNDDIKPPPSGKEKNYL